MTNEKWWEDIAALFHATYERLAPSFGYKTREETAVPWDMVKENNRRLMTATVAEIMPAIVAEAERRGYERAMEEVKKAIITTADALLSGGTENEERFEAVIIPKSFFEKV